jgi:uncharacterized Fe-S cluster-containing radical SAM superfamily protein
MKVVNANQMNGCILHEMSIVLSAGMIDGDLVLTLASKTFVTFRVTLPGFVRESLGKFWKLHDNGFFQDLESFGKLIFGPLGYGKDMDFLKLV